MKALALGTNAMTIDLSTILIIGILAFAAYITLHPTGRRYTRSSYSRARTYASNRRRSRRRYY